MMNVNKAYIIAIKTEKSMEYAAQAVMSCNRLGLECEIFEGTQDKTAKEAFHDFDPNLHLRQKNMDDKAACATVSHFRLWKRIAENKECAIILEHDAMMLHKPDYGIPDNIIVNLGYKTPAPWLYDHKTAGPPKSIHQIYQHAGAHAYAITHTTANKLLDELKVIGVPQAIDNTYFMRVFPEPDMKSHVPMAIVDPIAAIGWVRESTIWEEKPTSFNYTQLKSYVVNTKKVDNKDIT